MANIHSSCRSPDWDTTRLLVGPCGRVSQFTTSLSHPYWFCRVLSYSPSIVKRTHTHTGGRFSTEVYHHRVQLSGMRWRE